MPTINELKDFSTQVRRDIVRMVNAVNSGHPGGSLGCTEFMTALYQEVMEYTTDFDMDGKGEDLALLEMRFDLFEQLACLSLWGPYLENGLGIDR